MNKLTGFTLIELLVVLAVFAVLMLVGTDFTMKMVRDNNQTIIQNEVRQNANSVMQLLANSIRKANCVTWAGASDLTLTTYSDEACLVPTDTYLFNNVGRIYRNSQQIISDKIAACADTGCGAVCNQNGITVTGTSGTNLPVKINLTLQQTPKVNIRSDFCGRITLTNTITPRQY